MTLPTSGLITVNDRGARAATTFGSVAAVGGNMVFIKKLTASASATLSFVDGASSVVLDSTYKEYLFTFNNMHPATNSVEFQVNFRDGGTDYDATKTTTFFNAELSEADSSDGLRYRTAQDLAQSTAFQPLTENTGNRTDESCSGYLQLFNPSSTTFVKHFIARNNNYVSNNYSEDSYIAGYCNVTAAIDGVQFKFASGNIDTGDICLYGIL
jgi:hypothetical protein